MKTPLALASVVIKELYRRKDFYVLFVLTALEVLAYEIGHGSVFPALQATVEPIVVGILLVLSAIKFALVAMFYMHLKFDMKVLTWVFGFSLALAVVIISALILLFSYNRTLWWFAGKW